MSASHAPAGPDGPPSLAGVRRAARSRRVRRDSSRHSGRCLLAVHTPVYSPGAAGDVDPPLRERPVRASREDAPRPVSAHRTRRTTGEGPKEAMTETFEKWDPSRDLNDREDVPRYVDTNGIGRPEPGWRRRELAERFRDLLDELFENRVVAWSAADAQACARIVEDKRRRGEPLDAHVPDAFLAAAAAVRGLIIATRNGAEFRNAGVETVDPWTAGQR